MADRRNHVARGNFIGGASRIVSVLFGVAVAMTATAAAAQGAGPYYEDDSVLVDLSVLDDGGLGKRPAHLPPTGVVPGSSRGQMMPGTEPPRSRFHGSAGQAGSPQVSAKAKPAPSTRIATAKSRPAPVKTAEAPKPAVKREPPPKAAPVARVAAAPAEPPPASATTPPPPPPISTPAPLPPTSAPTAAPAAPEPVVTAARPPAAPEIAPAPAPSAPPAAMPAPPPVAAPAPVPQTPAPQTTAAPSQPLSIAPPAAPTPPAAIATAPVPPPAVAKPPEAPAQAALPPITPAGDRVMQISFVAGESRLPSDVQGRLKDLAEQMKAKEALRMQLVAYAAGGDLSSSAARRLSLSRALAVRTFLIDNGVRSTRIDVRALGDKAPDEPANRVDVSLSER